MPRLFLAVAATAALALSASADDSKLKVKVGDAFPDVQLEASSLGKLKPDSKTVSIADLKGKNVVIFFYPRALTGGCTTESCGFRDLQKEFPAGTVILGASNDPLSKQNEFTTKNTLPYPLLCDTESTLIKALGIMTAKGGAAQRVTFVVDRQGKIAKIYEGVKPATHPKEVLEFVKTMK